MVADVAAFTFRADHRVHPREQKRHDRAVRQMTGGRADRRRFGILEHEGPEQGAVPLTSCRLVADLHGNYVPGWQASGGSWPGEDHDPTGRVRASRLAYPLSAGLRGVAEGDAWAGSGVQTHPEVMRETRRADAMRWHRAEDRPSDDLARFARLTHQDGDCVVWSRPNRRGYAVYKVNGQSVMAARWAWEQVNGPIPSGMAIRPTCGNRACVKVAHLALTPKAAALPSVDAPLLRSTDAIAVAVGS